MDKTKERVRTLKNQSIAEMIEEIEVVLKRCKIDMRTSLQVCLSVEEALLNLQSHFGADASVELLIKMGIRYVDIGVELQGEKFDPVHVETDSSEWGDCLLSQIGWIPDYSYRRGTNKIRMKVKKPSMNPILAMFLYMATGASIGYLGMFLPDSVRKMIFEGVINPVYNTFFGLLTTIAGPMIFLSVIWGIIGIGDTAALGKIGKNMGLRFVLWTFIFTLFGLLAVVAIFPLQFSSASMDGTQLFSVFQMFLDILPSNSIDPFISGNSMQIIAIAVSLGIAIVIKREKAEQLISVVEQGNSVIQVVVEWFGYILPGFIVIAMIYNFWSGTFSMITDLWKVFLAILVIVFSLLVLTVVAVSIKLKVNLVVLVKKLLPAFIIAITTSSSTASFGTNVSCCKEKMGIDASLVNFGVPLGMVVYMPGASIHYLVCAVYVASFYEVEISFSWLFMAVIVTTLLAVATPPIPAGGLSGYMIMFTQLGLPLEALIIPITMEVLADFIATSSDIAWLQLEMLLQADKMDLLDHETLRSKENIS